MNEAAALFSGVAAVITSLAGFGIGIKFIWNKIDARLWALTRDLADCENKHDDCERATSELRVNQARQGVITRLAVEQLNRVDPNNIVTLQLKLELQAAFPFDEKLPAEVRELLIKLKGVPFP